MNSLDGSLYLKGPGDLDFEYGYEYVGDSVNFYQCPQTEKGIVGLYESVCRNSGKWKAVFVHQNNPLVRVGHTLNQFANACGMPLVKTSYKARSQYKYFNIFIFAYDFLRV